MQKICANELSEENNYCSLHLLPANSWAMFDCVICADTKTYNFMIVLMYQFFQFVHPRILILQFLKKNRYNFKVFLVFCKILKHDFYMFECLLKRKFWNCFQIKTSFCTFDPSRLLPGSNKLHRHLRSHLRPSTEKSDGNAKEMLTKGKECFLKMLNVRGNSKNKKKALFK